jgi:hypothetical protein
LSKNREFLEVRFWLSRYGVKNKKNLEKSDFYFLVPTFLIEIYWIPAKGMRGPSLRSGLRD